MIFFESFLIVAPMLTGLFTMGFLFDGRMNKEFMKDPKEAILTTTVAVLGITFFVSLAIWFFSWYIPFIDRLF